MENTLSAIVRKARTDKPNQLRLSGKIPAVVYGPQTKSLSLAIDKKSFGQLYKEVGQSKIFKLKYHDQDVDAIVHELQIHPLTNEVLHIDFYQIDRKKKITTKIPLVFVNESPAVKELGGILVKNISEVEIEALPKDLIYDIQVDLSPLKNFETKIIVKDLSVPPTVAVQRDANEVVVLVNPPRSEEELAGLDQETSEAEAVEAVAKAGAKKADEEESDETETKEEAGKEAPEESKNKKGK